MEGKHFVPHTFMLRRRENVSPFFFRVLEKDFFFSADAALTLASLLTCYVLERNVINVMIQIFSPSPPTRQGAKAL